MIPAKLVATLNEVSEKIIMQAAEDLEGEENNFKKLIEAAEIFRHANCNPIYLGNKDYSAFCVSSRETIDPKKLH